MRVFGIEIGKRGGGVETAKNQDMATMIQLPDQRRIVGKDSNKRQPKEVIDRGDLVVRDNSKKVDDLTDLISWS